MGQIFVTTLAGVIPIHGYGASCKF